MVSRFGERNVPTVWPASAVARQRLLSMEGKVKGNQDINVKNLRWNKRRIEQPHFQMSESRAVRVIRFSTNILGKCPKHL